MHPPRSLGPIVSKLEHPVLKSGMPTTSNPCNWHWLCQWSQVVLDVCPHEGQFCTIFSKPFLGKNDSFHYFFKGLRKVWQLAPRVRTTDHLVQAFLLCVFAKLKGQNSSPISKLKAQNSRSFPKTQCTGGFSMIFWEKTHFVANFVGKT